MKNILVYIGLIITTGITASSNYYVKEMFINDEQYIVDTNEVYVISTRSITDISTIDKFKRGFYNRPESALQYYKAYKLYDTVNYIQVEGVEDFDRLDMAGENVLFYVHKCLIF